MLISVVIPTYNRQPILAQCLRALEQQHLAVEHDYEVIVVDDGSTDGTVQWLAAQAFPHIKIHTQTHQGPAAARNLGIQQAHGEIIVFVDSDVVVTAGFLQAHAQALHQACQHLNHDCFFTYGRVIHTCNFDHPTAEDYKLGDFSAAYFATTNVAIARHWLVTAGLFDTRFNQYGWEDLELGIRLKRLGLQLIKAPEAVGYHWHPPFSLEQLPELIDKEIQRGRMGQLFYQLHPTWSVRLMVQMTWFHRLLWGLLTLGGHLNQRTLRPLLAWLIAQGKSQLALAVARPMLNWYTLKALDAADTANLAFILDQDENSGSS